MSVQQHVREWIGNLSISLGLFRYAHHVHARRHGYLWMDCPRCDVEFGADEWIDKPWHAIRVPVELFAGKTEEWRALCPRCGRRNKRRWAETLPELQDYEDWKEFEHFMLKWGGKERRSE